MSAITAKASRKMKKYAVLTREPRCFLGSFDFSWEQRKFDEVFDCTVPNNTLSRAELSYDEGTVLNVHYGDVLIKYGSVLDVQKDDIPRIPHRCREDFNGALLQDGDVIIADTAEDETTGKACEIGNLQGSAIVSGLHTMVCRPRNRMALGYLGYYLNSNAYHHQLLPLMQGIKVLSLSRSNIQKTSVSYPIAVKEQQLIAYYFSQLDNLITLHQRKCALLFSPFQAFISMMFITSTFSWEQRKLSEITDKVTEKNAGLQYVETFTNSAEFGIISQRDFFDHDIAKLGSLDGYYIVKTEDFVYNPRISTSAPVGPINRNKLGRTGVMSPLYTVFRPHDIDTTYLEYFFKCGYWHSFMNFNGDSGARSDRFSIRDNVFFQMPIPIPDIDEQRKIGELLTCLDNLITLHQRKCIFFTGRAGRLISTVNKKRITSSWEQRKLGDMMNVTSVKRIHQSDWTDSGVRFLRARDIVAAAKNEEPDDYLYISKEKYEEYSTLSGKVGVSDLLVTGVGTIGVPYLVRNLEPLYFKDGNIIWFQNSDKIDGKFLFYSFSAEQIQGFINESAGIGTVGTYTIESGKKTPISLPNQIEQAKVGEFFQQLDNLITLHQRKPFLMKWRTSDANRNQTNRLVL